MAEDAKTTVLGLFRNQEEAERAIDRLVKGGVPASDVGLLAPGQAAAGVGGGAVLGAVAGGLLGVASMAVAPGIGPIVTAGAWLPPIIGLATGASAGGTAGGLLSMAGTDDEGLHYRQQVQAGRALVNVTTDRPDEVRALLHEAGALEVADMGQSASAAKLTESEDKPKADQT